jgi:hypothetical protein
MGVDLTYSADLTDNQIVKLSLFTEKMKDKDGTILTFPNDSQTLEFFIYEGRYIRCRVDSDSIEGEKILEFTLDDDSEENSSENGSSSSSSRETTSSHEIGNKERNKIHRYRLPPAGYVSCIFFFQGECYYIWNVVSYFKGNPLIDSIESDQYSTHTYYVYHAKTMKVSPFFEDIIERDDSRENYNYIISLADRLYFHTISDGNGMVHVIERVTDTVV